MKYLTKSYQDKKKSGEKFSALTAYDYTFGRLLDDQGLDFILVGDSVGMVVLGHSDTTKVTLENMLHHTSAVARGVKKTLLVSDLPAHSAETPSQALESAKRLRDAGATAVKIEGGTAVLPMIETILASEIPVLGHIGMLPQHVLEEGGYRIKGKTPQQADDLTKDALALEQAGVFAMVLELVSPPLATAITSLIKTPTIGIGSGGGCDGQIMVLHDLLGLSPWFVPKFATPKANLAEAIQNAVVAYRKDVEK